MKKKEVVTNGTHPDFLQLVQLLDDYLKGINGDMQGVFTPHNTLENIHDVVILYDGLVPIACGGFKRYDISTVEIKRIFVKDGYRGKGFAKEVVQNLEHIARYKGYKYAVVETGKNMIPANALYDSLGYKIIPNFEPYIANEFCVCRKKELG